MTSAANVKIKQVIEINVPSLNEVTGNVLCEFSCSLRQELERWDKEHEVGIEYVSTPGYTRKESVKAFDEIVAAIKSRPLNINPRLFPSIALAKGNCEGYRVEVSLKFFPDDIPMHMMIGFDVASVKCWSVEDQMKIYMHLTNILYW